MQSACWLKRREQQEVRIEERSSAEPIPVERIDGSRMIITYVFVRKALPTVYTPTEQQDSEQFSVDNYEISLIGRSLNLTARIRSYTSKLDHTHVCIYKLYICVHV